MPNFNSHHREGPAGALSLEGPEKMHAFVWRHGPFFILLAVLAAQLVLLSFQINRNHDMRLFQVWTVMAFRPFQSSLHKSVGGTGQAWGHLRDLWKAEKENQRLQVELVAARTQLQQLAEQAGEADRLRTVLDFKLRLPFSTVAAEVIASSPGQVSSAVFVDKGSNSGLTNDLPVITPDGIVGKIVAVFPNTSQVLLITDSSSGVGCMFEKSRVQGVLKGDGRSLGQLHYIMNQETVSPGDAIVTSGLDQIYPKGLSVGEVTKVSEGDIYKNIVVRPAARLDRLETVLVCLKPAPIQQQATRLPPR